MARMPVAPARERVPMSGTDGAIVAREIHKRYGGAAGNTGLNGFNLEVAAGSVQGLLGPNGAGKTTAIRILSTLLGMDSGSATVAGFDVFDDVRRLVPPGAKVLAAGTYATWHVGRPILPSFLPAVRPLFADPGLSRETAVRLLRERGIRYFLAPSSSRYRLLDLGLATPLASEGGFTLYAIDVDP